MREQLTNWVMNLSIFRVLFPNVRCIRVAGFFFLHRIRIERHRDRIKFLYSRMPQPKKNVRITMNAYYRRHSINLKIFVRSSFSSSVNRRKPLRKCVLRSLYVSSFIHSLEVLFKFLLSIAFRSVCCSLLLFFFAVLFVLRWLNTVVMPIWFGFAPFGRLLHDCLPQSYTIICIFGLFAPFRAFFHNFSQSVTAVYFQYRFSSAVSFCFRLQIFVGLSAKKDLLSINGNLNEK